MRVLIDTNVFISYLLNPEKNNKLQFVVESAFENKYILILPQEVFEELKRKLETKTFLRKYISQSVAKMFITALRSVVEFIPLFTEPIPEMSRDKKDDYLLVYSVIGEVDYLVTGDNDLQVLKKVGNVKIVSPAEFYGILKGKKVKKSSDY